MAVRRWIAARSLALVVAVSVLVGGCAGAGSAGKGPAKASDVSRESPHTVEVSLAAVGVATVADETSTSAVVPLTGPTVLRLTSWQTSNLAAEAAGHGGITGANLNAMLPTPGAPPLDDILSSWVLAGKDPAELAAGRLLGGSPPADPGTVVFPAAVLTLFVADALQHVAGPAPASPAAAESDAVSGSGRIEQAAQTDALSRPCSAVADFISSVLERVFSLLKLDPATVGSYVNGALGGGVLGALGDGLASWAASFLGGLVDAAQAALEGILNALTAPVLNLLRLVLGGLATITMIASYLKRWRANVTPDPSANAFALTGAPDRTGTFTVQIDKDAEIESWPDVLVDCASAAGVPLPTLSKAGLPVTWTVAGQEPGLVAVEQPTAQPPYVGALNQDLASTMLYVTGHEDAKLARTGTPVTPTVTVMVGVRRTEVDALRKFVAAFAEAQLPHVLAPVVNPIIEYYVELATKQLDRITQVEGSASITVLHHVSKPTQSPAPCTSGGTAVPTGTYDGTVNTKVVLEVDEQGLVTGKGVNRLHGPVHLVSNGTSVTGYMRLGSSANVGVHVPVGGKSQSYGGRVLVAISGPASAPTAVMSIGGAASTPLSLHLTRVGCAGITGDLAAMERDYLVAVGMTSSGLRVVGTAPWSAKRD